MKKMLCILRGAATLAVLSCQKPNDDLGPSALSAHSLDEVKLVDGRLVFPDFETMLETVALIGKKGPEEWSKKYPAFKSLLTTFDEFKVKAPLLSAAEKAEFKYCYRYMIDKDGAKSLEPSVSGRTMGSLVNAQGLVQIGDSVLRVSDEKVLKTHIKSIGELSRPESGMVKQYEVMINNSVNGTSNAKMDHQNLSLKETLYPGEYDHNNQTYRFSRTTHLAMFNMGWGYWFSARRFGFMWIYDSSIGMVHEKKNGNDWNLEDTDGWNRGWAYFDFTGAASSFVNFPPETVNGQRSEYRLNGGGSFVSSTGSTNYWGLNVAASAGYLSANYKGGVFPPGVTDYPHVSTFLGSI